ncbi:MAG: ATP-dependent DNA helicase RecG [Patescibacteria group bacterium]|nr:ATP-dependent DNA helicase RecG [Patescibacteria group bacterium]MDD5294610.1 ATP-dependent DNA helicase RecG [Patescibacteria group bacterium]MDD5555025.1 ATP-dependent DNA helicase RecG [Patescibacteria group bacterium]
MLTLDTDIINISRVGKTTAKYLNKLGITTVRDLLFYFPFRYDDFTHLTPIDKLQPETSANVVGQIELIENKRSWRRRMYITEALITDGTETLKVIWFNQPFIARNLRVGDKVSLAGKIEEDAGGLVMKSPVYEKIYNPPSPLYQGGSAVHTQGFVPNYHLTASITQKQLRFLIKQIIGAAKQISDWLPAGVKRNLRLLDLSKAIAKIHFPKTKDEIESSRQRLAFNELFLIQIQSQLIKKELEASQAEPIPFLEETTKKFVSSLPWQLTDAQRKAAWEILQDIAKDKPMSRLLSGDVGSGKTIVALIAMLNAALNGYQAVLMAPTEILAHQHFETISGLLKDFNIPISLITSSEKKIYFKGNIQNMEESEIRNPKSEICIGTHALIQEKIEFKNLGLAIIDEQHRFGVEQRKTLMENGNKKTTPHLLSMTATPIPRSLALALYGDLNLSIINQMPKGRKPILTKIVPEEKRLEAYNFIRQQIDSGRQIFVICPLIDPSDKLGVKSVKQEFEKLDKQIFPDLKIGILHGRMKPAEKEKIMREFLDNKIKILVATSVIEVGVDVPNAAIMMIEGAERFGLAQLHQFRGRVGRSQYQSYCFLFTENSSAKTAKRLQALTTCHDGFALAKMDLKFRGAGEIYGTAQKGFPQLIIASLFDYKLMKEAQVEAIKIIEADPDLKDYPLLAEKLGDWEKNVHLE